MFPSIFSFWRKWRRRVQANWYRRVILELEEYEKRIVPSWTPAGPAPQLQGERDLAGNWNQDVTGRITALAIGQYGDEPALFLGAASGGVWRSTDFATTDHPTWTPLTDNLTAAIFNPTTGFGTGAINVGAIAVDPKNENIIYVGTGEGQRR
jgi:hypothetical protein